MCTQISMHKHICTFRQRNLPGLGTACCVAALLTMSPVSRCHVCLLPCFVCVQASGSAGC